MAQKSNEQEWDPRQRAASPSPGREAEDREMADAEEDFEDDEDFDESDEATEDDVEEE